MGLWKGLLYSEATMVQVNTATAVDDFLRFCEQRNLSAKTVGSYRWALDRLSAFADLPTKPSELQLVIGEDGLAGESRFDLWRRLRTFYRWAEDRGWVTNAMNSVERPIVRKRFPRILNHAEIASMFEACLSRRDTAMVSVLLDTGMRVGELANMKWSDVTPDGVTVSGKTGDRFLPLAHDVWLMLEGQRTGQCVWMGRRGPLKLDGVSQAVRRVMYRAGIHPPKAGPHTLRHTFGFLYVMHGGDPFSLRRLMGHTSFESTMLYVGMNNRDLIEQHQRFAPSRHIRFPAQ